MRQIRSLLLAEQTHHNKHIVLGDVASNSALHNDMAVDEDVFMQTILDDLGCNTKGNHEVDLAVLLEGAENWDWADMEADIITPKKMVAMLPNQMSAVAVKPPLTPHRACSIPSSGTKQDLNLSMAALLEGAETWDWEDMESDFLTPGWKCDKLKSMVDPEKVYTRTPSTRCVVEVVEDNSKFGSKVLSAKTQPNGHPRSVILQDNWADFDVRKGDIINVLGHFDKENAIIVISSHENLLIQHPDLLLTATALSTSPYCTQKPLLSSMLHSSCDVTPALLWGNILHEIMQACLATQQWDGFYVEDLIEAGIMKNLPEIVKIQVTIEDSKREVKF
ncbi:DNA replication factor Dna2-domain-containing protein [Chiua virens]|nr:DNA replication factor Dna2-domain-containing protein [Chiua virens]